MKIISLKITYRFYNVHRAIQVEKKMFKANRFSK